MKKGAQMSVPQRDICGSEVRQHLVNKAWVDDLERGNITCLQDVGHQLQRPQVITGQGSGGRAQLVEHTESGVGAAGNLTAEVLLAQLLGYRQETQVNLTLVLMNRFRKQRYDTFAFLLSLLHIEVARFIDSLPKWSYIVNSMTADNLATQGTRASTVMLMAMFSQIITVSAPERLNHGPLYGSSKILQWHFQIIFLTETIQILFLVTL